VHRIALFQQELRQVAAVLAGDAGDQRVLHHNSGVNAITLNRCYKGWQNTKCL
jgi:hypothetical protein